MELQKKKKLRSETPDPVSQLQLALAELDATRDADQTATELALAELADLITGGVS
ncbi:hypothetical protein SDC9_48345 [bioreactor metagenome]|uniref:Uncharacterized protein n=1 Tax=bioreactor metagenome TaxID=1076179 RepID=A0A644WE51_9ZZZZ